MTVTTWNCVCKPAEYINMAHAKINAKIKLYTASLTTHKDEHKSN